MDIMTVFVHYPVGDLPHETPSSDHYYYYDNITDYDDISPMGDDLSADDYFNPEDELTSIDNGQIFKFARHFASEFAKNTVDGDIAASTAAYEAMVDTVMMDYNTANKNFTGNFQALCNSSDPSSGAPAGCAMIVVEFYSGFDYSINDFYYQFRDSSCTSSIVHPQAVAKINITQPERLTQVFYNCYMRPWDAFFQAAGLASANTQLYMGFAFTLYLFLVVKCLNYSRLPVHIKKGTTELVRIEQQKLTKPKQLKSPGKKAEAESDKVLKYRKQLRQMARVLKVS
jgi:hypothetical protein